MEKENFKFKELIASKGGNKSEIGRKLGISSQLLGQYEQGRQKPKSSFFTKWEKVYGENISHIFETNVSDEISPVRTDDRESSNKTKAESHASDISALIAQNTTLIESHNRLTRTLEMLVRERTASTVEKQQQFEAAYLARLADVLEVMIDIGTGKKWKTRDEAREALNRFVTDPLGKT